MAEPVIARIGHDGGPPLIEGLAPVPLSLDTLLRRDDLAKALTAVGYPITTATLATRATRGGSPPYRLWGRYPLYRWGDALAWAEGRLSKPVTSTSELDVPNGAQDAPESANKAPPPLAPSGPDGRRRPMPAGGPTPWPPPQARPLPPSPSAGRWRHTFGN